MNNLYRTKTEYIKNGCNLKGEMREIHFDIVLLHVEADLQLNIYIIGIYEEKWSGFYRVLKILVNKVTLGNLTVS